MELDCHFLSQFVLIRRSFFLRRGIRIDTNFYSMIDITSILNKIECNLEDILNVYKIVHNRFRDLNKNLLIKCDRVVTEMGYDKEWSEYYFNSRILNNLAKITRNEMLEE